MTNEEKVRVLWSICENQLFSCRRPRTGAAVVFLSVTADGIVASSCGFNSNAAPTIDEAFDSLLSELRVDILRMIEHDERAISSIQNEMSTLRVLLAESACDVAGGR